MSTLRSPLHLNKRQIIHIYIPRNSPNGVENMNSFLNRNVGLSVIASAIRTTQFYASFRRLSLFSCTNREPHFLALNKLGKRRGAINSIVFNPTGSSPPSAYSPLLQLCTDSCALDDELALHNHLMPARHAADLQLGNKFIIFYARVGNLTMARRLFDKMSYRSVVTWTALISGYSRSDRAVEALELFFLMRSSGISGNQFTYGSVLRACTSLGCIGRGQQIHGCITKSRFEDNLIVQTALINMHLKCGSVSDAGHLFARMEKKDAVAWNSIIGGCAVRGLRDDAFRVFSSMIREGKSESFSACFQHFFQSNI